MVIFYWVALSGLFTTWSSFSLPVGNYIQYVLRGNSELSVSIADWCETEACVGGQFVAKFHHYLPRLSSFCLSGKDRESRRRDT